MNNSSREKEKKTFSLFAPYIRDFIYREGWENLRQIQMEAADVIFSTQKDLIISSGTATGKTEAALFPILSLMEKEDKKDFQVLYISPIKALINDQFERTGEILRESGIPVFHYHGDVSQNKKEAFFKNPKGILQITPESLESLLLRRWEEIPSFFSSLRFVIIDEIHALMGSDRGLQVLSILDRMETVMKERPRRIGLSATVSNLEDATFWLSRGKNETATVISSEENKSLRLGLEYFSDDDSADEWIYRATKGQKSIVFSNSREETEKITASLTKIAKERKENNRFYIHHGNLSFALRNEAEEMLKSDKKEVTVLATSTLEFGIDIEKLKRVICQESPMSVSSFLQRLGRSGRRDASPEMLLAFRKKEGENLSVLDAFPWELLQGIAIIELYRKEKWIEEAEEKDLPASLLFHQTLCVLRAEGPKSPRDLAARVLSLSPFKKVKKEDFKTLLIHLLEREYLSLSEENLLVLGLKSERILGNYRFLSVFQSKDDFTVIYKNEKIGATGSVPPKGKCFSLGGRVWETEEIDFSKKTVFVRPGKDGADTIFLGAPILIHERIPQKMGEILFGSEHYPYLFPDAEKALEKAREMAQKLSLADGFLSLGHGEFALIPFTGSKAFESIKRIFANILSPLFPLQNLNAHAYQYLTFSSTLSKEELYNGMKKAIQNLYKEDFSLIDTGEYPLFDKYDALLPRELAKKAFEENRLDTKGAILKLTEIFK